jgi:hypothetical protein
MIRSLQVPVRADGISIPQSAGAWQSEFPMGNCCVDAETSDKCRREFLAQTGQILPPTARNCSEPATPSCTALKSLA